MAFLCKNSTNVICIFLRPLKAEKPFAHNLLISFSHHVFYITRHEVSQQKKLRYISSKGSMNFSINFFLKKIRLLFHKSWFTRL